MGLVVQATVPGYGRRYRRWVRDSLRYLDVQDLATGGDHVPELGEVYVNVALVSRTTPERHSIGEFLDRRSPVILAVTGQPGSGKSTMLADAARRSAQTGLRGRLGRRSIPILLALREHAGQIVADPAIPLSDVVRDAVGGGAGREPGGWWGRQLRRGRCLILLDGLDEVARADDRIAVADWVGQQISAYPGNHFVVTSRSYGLPGQLTDQADVFAIRPFTADQVQLFLDRWYLAAERHATGISGRTAQRAVLMRARESAARLTSLLRQHPALHDLAVNPLLLTMIATAHRYRGALPDSRADLYGEICHVLLARRTQAKDLPELLSWPAKQALVGTLAYQMMRDHVSSLPSYRVLEILAPQLERFSPSVTGEAVLDDISRNGLFIESPSGGYSFAHLTFQEYLAAQHVSANPALVKSLADSVSDPWWHEAILLYAATGDASPIVRACLESGTIPALTLAFDCGEASTEIDPDLRQRLAFERQRAFDPGCSAEHRRLIAGVAAARLTRQTLTTAAGTRICARPVPADLYWLFLADTRAPWPDSPCDPHIEQPATGIWGAEAQAFVAWLNSITATATGTEVRLPRPGELEEEAVASALSGQLPASVTGVWAQPRLSLWPRPGQPHPHALAGAALHQAIGADTKNTALVLQILNAAVLNVALTIVRDLDDIRALSGALADDLTARASSGGQAVDLMHAHAHAIVLTYTHALDLARADAITRTRAADPDLISTLDLAGARTLADAIAGDVARGIGLARRRAVEFAEAIDLDLSVLSAFDFDIGHAIDLVRVHASDLDRADLLTRGVVNDAAPDLARAFGLTGASVCDPALPLPAVLGLPLRWVADGPLASTLLQVLTESPASSPTVLSRPGDPYLAFALALSSRAGIHETTQLRADLGSSLTSALRDLAAAESHRSNGSPDSDWVAGLNRLMHACEPICDPHRSARPDEAPGSDEAAGSHQAPGPDEAAALRIVATALAGDSTVPWADAADVLRTVAATVTVIENRRNEESKPGESIILALI